MQVASAQPMPWSPSRTPGWYASQGHAFCGQPAQVPGFQTPACANAIANAMQVVGHERLHLPDDCNAAFKVRQNAVLSASLGRMQLVCRPLQLLLLPVRCSRHCPAC